MRNSFALLTLALLIPVAGFAGEWNKHFDISGKPELHVTAGNASVVIHAGPESGISASVKTKGWSIGDSGVRVTAQQNGGRLDLRIDMPAEPQHFDWNEHYVKVDIRVPQNLMAVLHTGNGPITLEDVHGEVQAQTGHGPVRIEGFDGTLEADTGNGPLKLSGKFDELQIHTGNGPVELTAETGSRIQSSWRLHTGNGPVQIKLPSSLSADFSLHTGNGPISMDLPLTTMGDQTKHDIHGKLNGGGPEISVHTGNGPISIGRS